MIYEDNKKAIPKITVGRVLAAFELKFYPILMVKDMTFCVYMIEQCRKAGGIEILGNYE